MTSTLLSSLRSRLAGLGTSSTAKKGSIAGAAMASGVGLDQLLEKSLFVCPSVNYGAYGTVFMVVPGIIIGLLTFLTSKFFVDGFQGCYRANAPKRVLIKQFVKITVLSTGAFLAYISACFLRYKYYVCLRLGPKPAKNPPVAFARVTAEAQIIGWFMVAGLVLLSFVAVVVQLCFLTDPNHDPDFPNRAKYERLEAMAAAKMFHDKMKQLAEDEGAAKVEMLFDERKNDTETDPVDFITNIRKKMLAKYPRGTGDLSLPFRNPDARRYSRIKRYLDDHVDEGVQLQETKIGEDETLVDGDGSSSSSDSENEHAKPTVAFST